MWRQPVRNGPDFQSLAILVEPERPRPAGVADTATATNSPDVANRGARPIAQHLQTAWRLRQFAGSRYFGSATIPKRMNTAEMAAVDRALERLGPFGADRIDNIARLHAAIINTDAASAEAVLTLVFCRIIHPDQRGPDGDTLLQSLVEHGRFMAPEGLHDPAARQLSLKQRMVGLIRAGADQAATDHQGRTAFERILRSTRPDWFRVAYQLLDITPDKVVFCKVSDGPTLLHRAARHGDVDFVKRWVALRLPLDMGIRNWRAISDGEVLTPLRRALKNASLAGMETARVLLDAGADHNVSSPWIGNTMLHRAVRDADLKLIKGWIAASLPLDEPTHDAAQMTALMQAVVHHPKRADLLDLLCQVGPLDTTDAIGRTAIHHAVLAPSRSAALDTLIEAGANLDSHTDQGEAPLHIAISKAFKTNDDLAFWKLVGHGADLDLPNPVSGITPRTLYNRLCYRWGGVPL